MDRPQDSPCRADENFAERPGNRASSRIVHRAFALFSAS